MAYTWKERTHRRCLNQAAVRSTHLNTSVSVQAYDLSTHTRARTPMWIPTHGADLERLEESDTHPDASTRRALPPASSPALS